jgi:hypothetical protein
MNETAVKVKGSGNSKQSSEPKPSPGALGHQPPYGGGGQRGHQTSLRRQDRLGPSVGPTRIWANWLHIHVLPAARIFQQTAKVALSRYEAETASP